MLKVSREKMEKSNYDYNYYNYYLVDGDKRLAIVFCDNGDLYFYSFDRTQETEFEITKENMTIYNLFSKLFDSFEKCEVFQVNKNDLLQCSDENEEEAKLIQINELNQRLKNGYIYQKIYDGKKITWISDDSVSFDYETADSMTIIKETNCYKLKFTYYENEFPYVRSIRIRNARSRYKPFNMLMMNFFNSLQEYDPDFHQIHIEEYFFGKCNSKKLKRK